MKKIWIDFTNPPHVNFFNPLIEKLKDDGFTVFCTARDFVETAKLIELYGIDYRLYGRHGGKKKYKKILALGDRVIKLVKNVGKFDISFSSNNEAPFVSWLMGKPAIVFDDNDISPNWLYSRFAKYVVSPVYIDKEAMQNMGIDKKKLITYPGFKEDIYIGSYRPDPNFPDLLPFSEFVTVRPENIQAAYVPSGVKSIVPELINKLLNKGYNILYLPRYQADRDLIKPDSRIFIPDNPLNGLDVSYYSQAIMTGAGSFSREAALLGTPAVSFFAGNKFLGVDKAMFSRKMVYYSRNVDDIVNYLITSVKREPEIQKSKSVQDELVATLEKLINE